MSRISHRIVNELDHPVNNTWTLKEKITMPEVRWAIAKFFVASLVVGGIGLAYWHLSTWVWFAMPRFHLHYWRDKTGCSENSHKMVVFDCHFAFLPHVDDSRHLKEATQLTLADFGDDWIMHRWFDCKDTHSVCFAWIYHIIQDYVWSQPLFALLSWASWTFLIFHFLITRFPALYWTKVSRQLNMPTPEGVRFLELSSAAREQHMAEMISPRPPPHTPSPPLLPSQLNAPIEERKENNEPVVDDILGLAQLGDELNPLPVNTAIDDGIRHRPVPKHRRGANAPPPTAPSNAATPRNLD